MKQLTIVLLAFKLTSFISAQDVDSLIDVRDGQKYGIVKIGSQWWMQENLNIGFQIDTIDYATDNDTIEKYCYNNDPEMCETYGGLYSWEEAMNHPSGGTYEISDNICPIGWYIPTEIEWENLVDSLGGWWAGPGGKLKATGTEFWKPPNYGATNETGFSALPGGFLYYSISKTLGDSAYFWTSTQKYGDNYWVCLGVWADYLYGPDGSYVTAASIRCMLDSVGTKEIQVTNMEMETITKIKFEPVKHQDTILIHNSSARENIWINQITSLSGAFDINVIQDSIESGGSIWASMDFVDPNKILMYDTLYIDFTLYTGSPGSEHLIHKIPIEAALPLEITFTDSNQVSCFNADDGTAIITPSHGYPPYNYLWNDELLSTDSTLTGMKPNRYYMVKVTDFTGQTQFDSIMLTEPDSINIMAEYSEVICQGSSDGYINLNVSGGIPPYSYNWSNGSTDQNRSDLEPGTYRISVHDFTECIQEKNFMIDAISPSPEEEICLITVDSTSKKIIVIWEPNTMSGISDYIILRESNTTDQYDSIGTASVSEPGFLIDTFVNPSEQSYQYKLAIRDSCGNRSDLSPPHSSIHLILYSGQDNVINLLWTNYSGFPVTNYLIRHGSHPDSMVVIKTLSGNNLNYTDNTPLVGKNYYQVEAKKETSCNPDISQADYQSSLSNIATSTIVGLKPIILNPSLQIYPNPGKHQSIISFPDPGYGSYQLILTDIHGKAHRMHNDITKSPIILEYFDLQPGLYFVELRGSKIYRGKIIIE